MEAWYLLYSKPRKEALLRDELTRRGVSVYLPLCPPHGRQTSSQPLFFRYLFAQLDLQQASPHVTRWVPGLSHLVMFGEQYVTVPETVISFIQQRVAELQQQWAVPFYRGQPVRLAPGHPLGLLEGSFDRTLAGGTRARILLEVLGRLIRCEVELRDLEALNEGESRLPIAADPHESGRSRTCIESGIRSVRP